MNNTPDFQALRDQWALKALVTKDTIDMHMRLDMNQNLHNDSYKPIRRGQAEIHSDVSYAFADEVLKRQYGSEYTNWIKSRGYTWDEAKNVFRCEHALRP